MRRQRKQNGQFAKGCPPGPGRPVGARHRRSKRELRLELLTILTKLAEPVSPLQTASIRISILETNTTNPESEISIALTRATAISQAAQELLLAELQEPL